MEDIEKNIIRITALLPDRCRKAFYLRVVEGLPVGEIALRRGCSVLQVYCDLEYARRYVGRNVGVLRGWMGSSGRSSGSDLKSEIGNLK